MCTFIVQLYLSDIKFNIFSASLFANEKRLKLWDNDETEFSCRIWNSFLQKDNFLFKMLIKNWKKNEKLKL